MGTNEQILKKLQAAIEAVKGTGLATTRIVYAKFMGKYDKPLMDFQDTTGTFFDRRRPAYAREKISFTFNDIMTFEDAPWWMQFFMKGGVTGAGDAGTPIAYTYTFFPTASVDDLATGTFEHGEPGNAYETNQVSVTQATMRMDSDNDNESTWMLDLECYGIGWVPTTYTAAIPDRTTEVIPARGTEFFLDDGGGTIGSTQKLGSLISASITVATGAHGKAFSENETGLAPGKSGRNAYRVDGQLVMEFDSDVEFAKYRNSTPQERLIRLYREGTNIHGTPTVNKSFTLDLWGYYNGFTEGDRDGNMIGTFSVAGFYNVTDSRLIEAVIVNGASTLP